MRYHRNPSRRLTTAPALAACVAALCLALPAAGMAQQAFRTQQDYPVHPKPPAQPVTPPPETNYDHLVRIAIQNQMHDKVRPPYLTWMERDYHGKSSTVARVVEIPAGSVSSVQYIDDQPLNEKQQRREAERVRKMIDPDRLWRHKKSQQEDDARTQRILASIPDAFTFQHLRTATAENGHRLVTLLFQPRPGWDPPNHETMVFLGMRGTITIDETAMRLTKIDGTLFKDVTFGWGIFGRLYKGGRFLVEQVEVTPAHWDTSRMYLHFDGKILLFKSVHFYDNELSWDYKTVPPMTLHEALAYLADHPDSQRDALLHH